ncbi:hypothetical protein POV27_15080 [Aureisphaera galaxeae]|uniref:hypothetical protein n=1 Tax=Aureisphaera galaxeae TaxID=1538023 RepID=UPI002350A85F|nr:hypothetical protein [Aureisphaera galaxeae]MDC8005385.1 hypothetical protein [Aureisphaera galaxeae]
MSDEVKNNETETPAETPFVRYDEYWLTKARTLIDGSIETFNKRLKTLNNFLNYLAGGTFLAGASFATYMKSTELEVYVLAAIPLLVIAVAKMFVGVKGSEPAMEDTNMRSPAEINEDYAKLLTKLSGQVKEAGVWVGIATAFTLVCLPFSIYFHNKHAAVEQPASYVHIESDGTEVRVTGLLPKGEDISVFLHGKNAKKEKVPAYTTTLLKEENGSFNAVYSIKDLGLTLDSVVVQYGKDNKLHSYTYKLVKGGASANPARAEDKPKKDPKADKKKKDTTKVTKKDTVG